MPKLGYEQSLKRLEQIVGKLESGECELEEAIKLFEEGTKLSASCYAMLEKAEQKIINIKKKKKTEE